MFVLVRSTDAGHTRKPRERSLDLDEEALCDTESRFLAW